MLALAVKVTGTLQSIRLPRHTMCPPVLHQDANQSAAVGPRQPPWLCAHPRLGWRMGSGVEGARVREALSPSRTGSGNRGAACARHSGSSTSAAGVHAQDKPVPPLCAFAHPATWFLRIGAACTETRPKTHSCHGTLGNPSPPPIRLCTEARFGDMDLRLRWPSTRVSPTSHPRLILNHSQSPRFPEVGRLLGCKLCERMLKNIGKTSQNSSALFPTLQTCCRQVHSAREQGRVTN
jgi:hypothetical protein